MTIHPSALLAPDLSLGDAVDVGPFSVVGMDGDGAPPVFDGAARLRSHVVVYRGSHFGPGFHAAHHVLVREHTIVGRDVSIGSGSVVEHHVRIADGVRLHSGCFVPEHSVLQEGAWLGPGVILTNARHPNRPDTKDRLEGVTIGVGAVVGAGAVVLPGVHVGDGAMVGAGAVVVDDVPAGATVVGNPSRSLTA